jgi:hypothetical protein
MPTHHQPQQKLPWQFVPKMEPELRNAHALEYIAHYLDRIEGHFAKIVETLTEDPAGGSLTVMRALQDIAEAAKKL